MNMEMPSKSDTPAYSQELRDKCQSEIQWVLFLISQRDGCDCWLVDEWPMSGLGWVRFEKIQFYVAHVETFLVIFSTQSFFWFLKMVVKLSPVCLIKTIVELFYSKPACKGLRSITNKIPFLFSNNNSKNSKTKNLRMIFSVWVFLTVFPFRYVLWARCKVEPKKILLHCHV